MDNSTLRILKKAVKIANHLQNVPNARKKHFSFLFNKNSIISIGWNNYSKTHPIAKQFGHKSNNIHSELHCILNLKRKITQGLTMVNIRINKNGDFRNSFPCKNCQKMLKHYRINNIIYSTNEGFLYGKI